MTVAHGSDIHVIVVGAGFAGLATAIECNRQGLSVEVYERVPEIRSLGDIISFQPNAGRIFARWGSVVDQMLPVSIKHTGLHLHKYTGEHIYTQPAQRFDRQAPSIHGHRGELHDIVFKYARDDLGIPIHFGCEVTGYFESGTRAGIEVANGHKYYADVVIASDGVHSQAPDLILGQGNRKIQSSGYAVYRSWFSSEDMLADPLTKHICENGDTFNGWIGPDIHLLVSSLKGGKDICWVLTHKDESEITDSLSRPGRVTDVREILKGWDPLCTRIISKTPETSLVDWKPAWQDPLDTWVSQEGRIALAGDSAHTFLPTSAQGAAQALEDGVTIAVCLKYAGRNRVPAALRAFENIRYERVCKVQATGKSVRDKWHKANWDDVKRNPKSMELPMEDWILCHDAQGYAEAACGQLLGLPAKSHL